MCGSRVPSVLFPGGGLGGALPPKPNVSEVLPPGAPPPSEAELRPKTDPPAGVPRMPTPKGWPEDDVADGACPCMPKPVGRPASELEASRVWPWK